MQDPTVVNRWLLYGATTHLQGDVGFVLEWECESDALENDVQLLFSAQGRASRDRWVRHIDEASRYKFTKYQVLSVCFDDVAGSGKYALVIVRFRPERRGRIGFLSLLILSECFSLS